MTNSNLDRRAFIKVMGATGTSLLFGIYLSGCDEAPSTTAIPTPESTATALPANLPTGLFEPDVYLKIESSGRTIVTAFRSEMGQGIRTAIAMILAEELDADWNSIVIEQAPTDSAYGDQHTGGSQSVTGSYFTLRDAGARVRHLLINAAATVWEVDPGTCTTAAGTVIHPDGVQTLSYGDLAGIASDMELPRRGDYSLKPEQDFRIIGTDIHHWDAPDIVTGKAVYGIDVRVPGMLYATVARCPTFGGSVGSFDSSKTLEVKGVQSVQLIESGIAVVADNSWSAIKGREALQIVWEGGNTDLSSASIRESMAAGAPQLGSAGAEQMDAAYQTPFQAHATMEPMNCTAHVQGDTCEIWAPTQDPQDVQRAVRSALGLGVDAVTVHVTLIGGGFGRRLEEDYAVEAAELSRAIEKPVQIVWTRADDIQHDFYHPMNHLYVRGNSTGTSQPIVRALQALSGIPVGAWRSVEHHPQAFARQCFIDEMAQSQGIDPVEFRRGIYFGSSIDVIELAASKADWGSSLPDGWGRGIAYHDTWGTHVAMVAEVEVTASAIRVHKVTCAVDCGTAVNPDNIAAQMEGSIAFGLTAALKGGVTLEEGRIIESNFDDCPMLQIDEMPQVEVHIVPSDRPPSGIGEPGVPPIAPAVANAVFDATGVRVRHLPITVQDLR